MIALQDINNKDFKILKGEIIPKDILKKIDVERLKELKIIGEEKTQNNQNFKTEKKESKE